MNAGFFVRLAAYLIDSAIVGVILAIAVRFPIWISSLVSPDNLVVRDFIFEYSIADIVVYVLSAMYFIILTYKTGATIGKRVLHLKVVSVEERDMKLFEVIYRETIGRFLSGLLLCAGYFMIALHGEKRGLHDLMSDTKVIYCHRKDVVIEMPVSMPATEEAKEYVTPSYVLQVVEETEQEDMQQESDILEE